MTRLSNGLHGAQHLCLSGTFAPDKQGRPFTEAPTSRIRAPGITEVYLAQRTRPLRSFSSTRRLAFFFSAKMNAGRLVLACTFLVGASVVR